MDACGDRNGRRERGGDADFDRSGSVDFPDFIFFVTAYGSRAADDRYSPGCDFDRDGSIGFADFRQFALSFGDTVPG